MSELQRPLTECERKRTIDRDVRNLLSAIKADQRCAEALRKLRGSGRRMRQTTRNDLTESFRSAWRSLRVLALDVALFVRRR